MTFRPEFIANFQLQLTFISGTKLTFHSLNVNLKTQIKGIPDRNASHLSLLRCYSCSLLEGRFFFSKIKADITFNFKLKNSFLIKEYVTRTKNTDVSKKLR